MVLLVLDYFDGFVCFIVVDLGQYGEMQVLVVGSQFWEVEGMYVGFVVCFFVDDVQVIDCDVDW